MIEVQQPHRGLVEFGSAITEWLDAGDRMDGPLRCSGIGLSTRGRPRSAQADSVRADSASSSHLSSASARSARIFAWLLVLISRFGRRSRQH
jgi:hypothetical protein